MPRIHKSLLILLIVFGVTQQANAQLPEPMRLGQPAKPNAVPSLHRTSIAFSPDGKKLAWVYHTADKAPNDGGGLFINLWDLEKRYALVDMRAATDFTYACSPLRFTPNGRMVVMGCFQLNTEHEKLAQAGTLVRTSVRVWLVASGKELPFTSREDALTTEVWQAVAVSPDGKAIIGVKDKRGRVWTFPDAKEQRSFTIEPASRLVLSADGKLAAGTVGEDTVRVVTTDDAKEAIRLPGGGRALAFSPDGKQLATVQSNLICLWDIASGKLVWTTPGKLGKDEDAGPRCDFSRDGKRLAWNEDGKITVTDAATGKTTLTITAEPGPIAFSPDGRKLALGCPDGTALVWDFEK